ncbi:MAG TPA: tetratricopeptide repeat protein [Vicinamibacterales bacterium]|nr:tetratricopeptide repeat protein [Vicinamibacterales bacterium]
MARRLHARAALTVALVATLGVLWWAPRAKSAARPTDFAREMSSIDADLAVLRPRAADDPDTATRLAFQLYHRATMTAQSGDFAPALAAVNRALDDWPNPDLWLLRATMDLRFHRLEDARQHVNAIDEADRVDGAQLLLADIDVQRGAYAEARRRLDVVIERNGTWDARSRLAWIFAREGDLAAADREYAGAEADLTAKEMRACAWLEVQWGQMYFARGQYDRARAHYERAHRAYSGYWLEDEYDAELLAASGRFDAAVARYMDAIDRAPRPDLLQQLGDLYVVMGRPREARLWHDRALAGYLGSAGTGDVQFFHHLATFYSDVRPDGPKAVEWANKDYALRPNEITADAVAWALYRSGRTNDAIDMSTRSLAGGIVDAHMLFHAAVINEAAGHAADAQRLRAALDALNPRYRDFHAHR